MNCIRYKPERNLRLSWIRIVNISNWSMTKKRILLSMYQLSTSSVVELYIGRLVRDGTVTVKLIYLNIFRLGCGGVRKKRIDKSSYSSCSSNCFNSTYSFDDCCCIHEHHWYWIALSCSWKNDSFAKTKAGFQIDDLSSEFDWLILKTSSEIMELLVITHGARWWSNKIIHCQPKNFSKDRFVTILCWASDSERSVHLFGHKVSN